MTAEGAQGAALRVASTHTAPRVSDVESRKRRGETREQPPCYTSLVMNATPLILNMAQTGLSYPAATYS